MAITWTGNNGNDVGGRNPSTENRQSGKGSKGAITWTGENGNDVGGFPTDTSNHDPSVHGGKGSGSVIDSPMDK